MSIDFDFDFDVEFDLGFLAFVSLVRDDAARFLRTSAATSDVSGRGDAVADDILPDLRSDMFKIERASIQEMLKPSLSEPTWIDSGQKLIPKYGRVLDQLILRGCKLGERMNGLKSLTEAGLH